MKINDSRHRIGKWIESDKIQLIITIIIFFNAVIIGFETSAPIMQSYGQIFKFIDRAIIIIFILEMFIKLYAFDYKYFKNPWNVFDFIIVGISVFPATGTISVLRALRILRTLRLLKTIPRLRFIVESLLRAVPSLLWIFVLLILVFYVFAVVGTKLFATEFPAWFGNIGNSMYTLFQVMTLESWSMGISRPVMEKYPYAFFYFIPFIIIATYTTLNIFIAIVVNTMHNINMEDDKINQKEIKNIIIEENYNLSAELEEIKNQLKILNERINKGNEVQK